MTQSALAVAIKRKNWDFVALCLLLGLAQTAEKFPPETLERLLDLLGAGERAWVTEDDRDRR